MSSKRAYAAIFIFTLVSLLCSGLYWLGELRYHRDELISHKQEIIKKQIQNAQENLQISETKILLDILSIPGVKDAFASRDRNKLFELVNPTFQALKVQNPHYEILHFHDEQKRSFLRMHNPQKFGDELSSYRPIIMAAQSQLAKQVGFEAGPTGMIYRVVLPVIVNQKLVGSVEIGVDICYFTQEIRKIITDAEIAVLIKKDTLTKAKNHKCEYAIGDYCSKGKGCISFLSGVREEFLKGVKEFKRGDKTVALDDSFTLYDFSGQKIGLVLCGVNVSSAITSSKQNLLQDIAATLLQTLAVVLFVSWLFTQHNKQILAKNSELDELNEQLNTMNLELEKRVKEQLSKIQAQEELLHQHAKLSSMGLMMSSVAHHWRQPLNIVGLVVQEICNSYEERYMSSEEVKAAKQMAMSSIQKMSKTIDDFSNFFKTDEQISAFWAKKFILDGINIAEPQLKSIDLEPSVEGDDVYILGAPHAFSQTVFAILVNAKDAIESSNITAPFITIHISKNESFAIVEIEDNAGGVPADAIEHIFEPYFSTKEQGKGIGIGLYVAKLYIEQTMGGCLSVQNTRNGAKFTIMLPLANEES